MQQLLRMANTPHHLTPRAANEDLKSKANLRIIVYFKHIMELDDPRVVQGLVDIVFP